MEEQLTLKQYEMAGVKPAGDVVLGKADHLGPHGTPVIQNQQAPYRPPHTRGMAIVVMKDIPDTRNDDRKLLTEILNRYFPNALKCPHCGENLKGIEFGPAPETVRRRRQEIQNRDGMLIPFDPDVIEQRKLYRLCPAEILSEERFTDGKALKAICRKCQTVRKGECNKKELNLEIETQGVSL